MSFKFNIFLFSLKYILIYILIYIFIFIELMLAAPSVIRSCRAVNMNTLPYGGFGLDMGGLSHRSALVQVKVVGVGVESNWLI